MKSGTLAARQGSHRGTERATRQPVAQLSQGRPAHHASRPEPSACGGRFPAARASSQLSWCGDWAAVRRSLGAPEWRQATGRGESPGPLPTRARTEPHCSDSVLRRGALRAASGQALSIELPPRPLQFHHLSSRLTRQRCGNRAGNSIGGSAERIVLQVRIALGRLGIPVT